MANYSGEAQLAEVARLGGAALPRLRAMERDELAALLRGASLLSFAHPLHLAPGPYALPGWSDSGVSGAEVMAVLAFGLFVLIGEEPANCPELTAAWPILEGLDYAQGGAGRARPLSTGCPANPSLRCYYGRHG